MPATDPAREEAMRGALLEHPDWSDRRLAAVVPCCRQSVARLRAAMVARGELAPLSTAYARDGHHYRVRRGPWRSNTLLGRLARLRRLARGVGDPLFRAADPATRRQFWLAADHLAAAVGDQIDIRTGDLLHRKARSPRPIAQ